MLHFTIFKENVSVYINLNKLIYGNNLCDFHFEPISVSAEIRCTSKLGKTIHLGTHRYSSQVEFGRAKRSVLDKYCFGQH